MSDEWMTWVQQYEMEMEMNRRRSCLAEPESCESALRSMRRGRVEMIAHATPVMHAGQART